MKKLTVLLSIIIALNAHSQIKVLGTDNVIYELDTTHTNIIGGNNIEVQYVDENNVRISTALVSPYLPGMSNAGLDSLLDSLVIDKVSQIKVTIDTAFVAMYVEKMLRLKNNTTPGPSSQRVDVKAAQKVFNFTLPASYALFVDGKLMSLEKDYTQSGGEFTLKRAAKKNSIVRLLKLE